MTMSYKDASYDQSDSCDNRENTRDTGDQLPEEVYMAERSFPGLVSLAGLVCVGCGVWWQFGFPVFLILVGGLLMMLAGFLIES